MRQIFSIALLVAVSMLVGYMFAGSMTKHYAEQRRYDDCLRLAAALQGLPIATNAAEKCDALR